MTLHFLGSAIESVSQYGDWGLFAIVATLMLFVAGTVMNTLLPTEDLEKQKAEIANEMTALNLLEKEGDYEWDDDEKKRYNELEKKFDKVESKLERYKKQNSRLSGGGGGGGNPGQQQNQPGARPGQNQHVAVVQGQPGAVPGQHGARVNTKEGFEDDPKCGFRNANEFFHHAMMYSERWQGRRHDYKDQRTEYLSTINAASRATKQAGFDVAGYINECHDGGDCGPGATGSTTDSTGSVFVPVEFAPDMFKTSPDMMADELGTTKRTSGAPMVERKYRVDKDHRDSVSGGFQVGRNFEHCCLKSSAAKHGKYTIAMTPVYGAYCASEMMLEMNRDMIIQEVEDGFNSEFDAQRIVEILNATGSGEYRGIWRSKALITHTPGGPLEAADIWTMTSRLWTGHGLRNRSKHGSGILWLAGLDYRKELRSLQNTDTENQTNSVVLYDPNKGPDWANGLLDGNPVIFTEFVPRSGYKHSLGLYNMAEFEEYTWRPMRNASSLHARFMCNEAVFKFWTYTGGQDRWDSTLIPKSVEDGDEGDASVSPFVVLDGNAHVQPKLNRPHNKKKTAA